MRGHRNEGHRGPAARTDQDIPAWSVGGLRQGFFLRGWRSGEDRGWVAFWFIAAAEFLF